MIEKFELSKQMDEDIEKTAREVIASGEEKSLPDNEGIIISLQNNGGKKHIVDGNEVFVLTKSFTGTKDIKDKDMLRPY